MIRKLNLILAILVGITASNSFSKILDWSDKKVFKVIGPVNGSIVRDAALLLLEGSKLEEVNILVNSPGGMVDTGLIYIQAINQLRSRGIKVNCSSGVLAASMGFQILAHCDNVYALPNTLLLFHPVAIGGARRLEAADLRYLYTQIAVIEKEMNRALQNKFRFPDKYFRYHYNRETLHQASELAKYTRAITIVSDIRGLDSSLYQTSRPGAFFNIKDIFRRLIYISPRFLPALEEEGG